MTDHKETPRSSRRLTLLNCQSITATWPGSLRSHRSLEKLEISDLFFYVLSTVTDQLINNSGASLGQQTNSEI